MKSRSQFMEGHPAEYRYYSRLLNPGNKTPDSEKVDLNEWARLLATEKLFVPGGRYGIIREHFEKHPKAKELLEIGCGSGVCVAWMQRFADRCFGADIYLAPHLQEERLDTCSFLQVNANDTFPMADGSYDVVVAMMIMEHVFDPFHFCQEVSRILRPNGIFFVNVPLITAIGHRLKLLFGGLPVTSEAQWFKNRAWDGAHLHYFTLPLLRNLLALYGLEVDWVRGVGRLYHLKTFLPTLLAKEISLRAWKRFNRTGA